jgi:hypothetical protein
VCIIFKLLLINDEFFYFLADRASAGLFPSTNAAIGREIDIHCILKLLLLQVKLRSISLKISYNLATRNSKRSSRNREKVFFFPRLLVDIYFVLVASVDNCVTTFSICSCFPTGRLLFL